MELEELSISNLLEILTENWQKPKELLEISKDYDDTNVQVTIYESCVVLISANIESGIKQIAKSWIDDYNKFVGASQANNSLMKAVQDSYYEDKGFNQKYREKIKNLHKDNNIPIDANCITTNLKNPKPDTFIKFFSKVGEKKFLERINSEQLSDLFSSNSDERDPIKEMILKKIDILKNNPMSSNEELLAKLNLNYQGSNAWKTFLDELVKARNKVAHGNEEQITLTKIKVKDFIEKAEYFQYLTVLNLYQIFLDDYNESILIV
ncbi:hypothetical protein A5821_002741 [Enterococcus sp. 7F3_DIV0205]|uniref:RiboL-PSP-HEPN domain-containing protein n=1 Tax=Candidatus Enterococcus palustris TaxID=1834189 RepID=A0AAQ3WAF7_9ENTE|nr:HEPN domain-containing protein [Enterococcus sp. 7F3_DIV0205]OTN83175.1 hypothetical protein A5821_003098 [Enterococcus sp. 7F3_DIV0205]